MMTDGTQRQGLANPDLKMPPLKINDGGDDTFEDVRRVSPRLMSSSSRESPILRW